MTRDREEQVAVLCVEAAPAARRAEALRLLMSREADPAARLAGALLPAGDADDAFAHLLLATRAGRPVGACWGQTAPGRTAIVWPPRLVNREPAATAAHLLDTVHRRLQREGVVLAQALLADAADPDARQLAAGGYRQAATLLYLVCDTRPGEPPPAGALEFAAYDEREPHRLMQVIDETYVDTRDVPSLNGVRDLHDVLDGYRHTGDYHPGRWFYVRANGRDVGCLLLTDHPDLDQFELLYMGLTPSARGRGWGVEIARYAGWLAGVAGRGQVLLAVDAANDPAIASYAAAGFRELDRRPVFLRVLAE